MKSFLLLLVLSFPFTLSAMPQVAITGVEYLGTGDAYSLKVSGMNIKAGDIVLITDERGSGEVRHARVKTVTDSGRAIVMIIDGVNSIEQQTQAEPEIKTQEMESSAAVPDTGALAAASAMPVHNNFADAADALCEKQRKCMMQEMDDQSDVSPQMRQMMTQMIDSMCASMRQGYGEASQHSHPLYRQVTACVSSMSQLSCADMDKSDQTPACLEMDRQAQKFDGR